MAMKTGSIEHCVDVDRILSGFEEIADLHVLTQVRPDVLREDAAVSPPGPLAGLSYVAKDVIDAVGYATTGGTPALRMMMPRHDATVIARLRAAGAVLAGKANLHELSFGITSNNAVFGPVRNPFDPNRIAGGSSGGSAVAVATGAVPFALAADTGGSTRIPAALCGIVGWRATHGRFPRQGVIPISPTRDTVGLLARSVTTITAVDYVLAGLSPPPSVMPVSHLRIGRLSDLIGPVDSAVATAYEGALEAAARAGHTIVDIDLGGLFATTARVGQSIALYEFRGSIEAYLAYVGADFGIADIGTQIASPDVRVIWERAASVRADEYRDAMVERRRAVVAYAYVLDDAAIDVVAYPTTPVTARMVGEDTLITVQNTSAETFDTFTRFSHLSGVLGHPSITLSAGVDDSGLPIGLELAARVGDDVRLLQIAATFEYLLPVAPNAGRTVTHAENMIDKKR